MTKFIADTALLAASMALMLAQYWFTFGLWPKSWWSFALCSIGMLIVVVIRHFIEKETEQ